MNNNFTIHHDGQNFNIKAENLLDQISNEASWKGRTIVLKFGQEEIHMDSKHLSDQLSRQSAASIFHFIIEEHSTTSTPRPAVRGKRGQPKNVNQEPSAKELPKTPKKLPKIPTKAPLQQVRRPSTIKNQKTAENVITNFMDPVYGSKDHKTHIELISFELESIKDVIGQCTEGKDFKELDTTFNNIKTLIEKMHQNPQAITSENLNTLVDSFNTLKQIVQTTVEDPAIQKNLDKKVIVKYNNQEALRSKLDNWMNTFLDTFIDRLNEKTTMITNLLN